MIYKRNTSAAYIVPESKVDIMLGRDEMKENGQNIFHIINFNIGKIILHFKYQLNHSQTII